MMRVAILVVAAVLAISAAQAETPRERFMHPIKTFVDSLTDEQVAALLTPKGLPASDLSEARFSLLQNVADLYDYGIPSLPKAREVVREARAKTDIHANFQLEVLLRDADGKFIGFASPESEMVAQPTEWGKDASEEFIGKVIEKAKGLDRDSAELCQRLRAAVVRTQPVKPISGAWSVRDFLTRREVSVSDVPESAAEYLKGRQPEYARAAKLTLLPLIRLQINTHESRPAPNPAMPGETALYSYDVSVTCW